MTHGRALTAGSTHHSNGGGKMEDYNPMVIALTEDDALQIQGGSPVQIATLFVGAFGAGFRYGYFTLAPRLFD